MNLVNQVTWTVKKGSDGFLFLIRHSVVVEVSLGRYRSLKFIQKWIIQVRKIKKNIVKEFDIIFKLSH